MELQNVDMLMADSAIPVDVQQVLSASRLGEIEHSERHGNETAGFVPSNPEVVYRALRAVDLRCAGEASFCEWGSGLGTATCLAAKLGFRACGIEIHPQLVDASRRLAKKFQLPAVFAEGSFVPKSRRSLSWEAYSDNEGRYPWLQCDGPDAYQSLGMKPASFDVVFAYPWPGEEYYMSQLFHELARPGSMFLRYVDSGEIRLLRKPLI